MLKNLAVACLFTLFLVPTYAYGQGESCADLKYACEHKDQLGEVGQGNCRRYRETCERRAEPVESCADLRYACMHKDQLGEQGAGNCRRYRETCHGRH